VIEQYLLHGRPRQPGKGLPWLFLGRKVRAGGQLSSRGMWWLVRRYLKKAGIKRNIHPHTFRHSFATHVLEGDGGLRTVQELMGHASISTMGRYLHVKSKRNAVRVREGSSPVVNQT
jgi:integrase/recombinase XerD